MNLHEWKKCYVSQKILLVDDSAADLARLKHMVANAGHTVVTATSGGEAIVKAKSEKPDLIFMDIVMEGADGFEATREIAKDSDTKGIPLVFVTSKNQKTDRVWAELPGGKTSITKPYTPEQILNEINALNCWTFRILTGKLQNRPGDIRSSSCPGNLACARYWQRAPSFSANNAASCVSAAEHQDLLP